MKLKNRKNLLHKGMDGYMRNLLVKLFVICMLSTTVSMIGQFLHKDMNEEKNLRGVVKFGTAVRDVAKHLEKLVDDQRGKLLAKVDKQELVDGGSLGKFYLTSLKPELVQEACDALKSLDISDFFIKKILILGEKYVDDKDRKTIGAEVLRISFVRNKGRSFVPSAILINTELESRVPSFTKRRFHFLHEAGHVRAYCSGIGDNKETQEVIADIFAIAALTRLTEKKNFRDFNPKFCLFGRPRPYLGSHEFVYHTKELFDVQQGGNKLNVIIYGQKIVSDREKDGYEQKITQKVEKLLGRKL